MWIEVLSSSFLSPLVTLGRAGPAVHVSNTFELWIGQSDPAPKVKSTGELTTPLLCCEMAGQHGCWSAVSLSSAVAVGRTFSLVKRTDELALFLRLRISGALALYLV